VRRGQNHSVTQTQVPQPIPLLAPVDAVSSSGPNLPLARGIFRAGLRKNGLGAKKSNHHREHACHYGVLQVPLLSKAHHIIRICNSIQILRRPSKKNPQAVCYVSQLRLEGNRPAERGEISRCRRKATRWGGKGREPWSAAKRFPFAICALVTDVASSPIIPCTFSLRRARTREFCARYKKPAQ